MAERRLALRRPDTCARCAAHLPAGTAAWWDAAERTVTCASCHDLPPDSVVPSAPAASPAEPPPVLERGRPGGSARAEGERRSAKREARVRARHPKLGGAILALTDDPASTRVWSRGAVGEERVGKHLEDARPRGIEVLHDCRIPRSRANIDHLVIGPTGVWVVDAKRYVDGKVERRDVGGWRQVDHRLYVRGRDQSRLIDGVVKQVGLVAQALTGTTHAEVPVHGALCFVDVQVGWFAKPFTIDGVLVTWRRELLVPILGKPAEPVAVAPEEIEPLARLLAATFRPQA